MATSEDVARVAGVAQSTVSYVMSGKRSISPATRQRVEDAIAQLDYHPNSGARALASRRTRVIGLVIPFRPAADMGVLMLFVVEIAAVARAYDYDVLLVTADEGPGGLRRLVGRSLCDALVVMEIDTADDRLDVIRSLGVPVVLIGVPDDPSGLTCVDFDFAAAGEAAVDELADLGHRRLALLAISEQSDYADANFSRRFQRGVAAAVERRGVDLANVPVADGHADMDQAIDTVLALDPPVTALVLQSSRAPGPALAALRQRGRQVGDDMAVVAVCPDAVAERQAVPLTSVGPRPEEVSRRAMSTVLARLGDVDPEGQEPSGVQLVPPVLARRASTRPPDRPPTAAADA